MRVALAMLALAASGGCRADHGAVLLRFTPDAAIEVIEPTYSSSETAVVFDPDGPIHFVATSNQGTLRLELVGPLQKGAVVSLAASTFTLELGAFDFVNQEGQLVVTSADPAIVTWVAVPMLAQGGDGSVSFIADGAGTFR